MSLVPAEGGGDPERCGCGETHRRQQFTQRGWKRLMPAIRYRRENPGRQLGPATGHVPLRRFRRSTFPCRLDDKQASITMIEQT